MGSDRSDGGGREGRRSKRCRFITSYDGVTRCREPVFFQSFCEFHFEAFLGAEIDERGHISEELSDQRRRREINFYGIEFPPEVPEGIDLDPDR